MADIFISHSGKDNEVAAALGERIRRVRPGWSVFYDKDNIRAGERWQERLRVELLSCRMVVALLSRNWLASPWCFTEAVTADFRGKDMVAIETEDLTSDDLARAPPIVQERQRVRLRDGDDRAWQELLEALDRSGLDPNDWFPIPPDIGPYPGLVAFDEKDAGVFFGRKQEITEYLGILDTLRGPDRSQVLVISGASGSGKSSLLRAGLIPRLRRKREWVAIRPFEVARDPVRNLLDPLREALAGLGIPAHGLDPTKPPNDARTLAQILDEMLWRLEKASGAWVLLPLDQAEALVGGAKPAGDPASLLLDALTQVVASRTRQVVVVATIRTEFVPRLEAAFAGSEVRLRQAPLSAIGSLAEIIEKPADRFGLEMEPGLSERIVEDVRTADALPLLAYTLKELSDRCGRERCLTLDEYRSLGGVQGAIAAKLALVLSDPEPTDEEVEALRRAFTRHLIRVDESAVEGERLLRRVVRRSRLPLAAARLIGRLVDAGLLTAKEGTIELAHERVIGEWPKLPLNTWLVQGAADRRLIDQLRQRADDDILPDGLFSQAEELLQRDHQLAVEEPALAKLVQRSRHHRQTREAERNRARMQLLAMQARRAAAEADTPDRIERAAALALESIEIARNCDQPTDADAIEAARFAVTRLPLQVLSQGSPVQSLVVLADGRLASGGLRGQIKLWPRDGAVEPVVLQHGTPVLSLAVLADGRLASGGYGSQIKLWPRDGVGEPVILSHGPGDVRCLAALADGRLASGGTDGQIRLWPRDSVGEPMILSHGGEVRSLVVLANGRLASGSGKVLGDDNGEIKLWPRDGVGEPQLLSHGASVRSLAVLADGRLASGGADGHLKLWPPHGVGEPVILSHGSEVRSLVVLADERLASGGEDGQIKLWPRDGVGEPVTLSHGRQVLSLAVLADGRLASGGEDYQIKLWPRDGVGEPVILQHGDEISSLVVLADGRLASGGKDGQINFWPRDGVGKPMILSHGSRVSSMAALADGRLASAGSDGRVKLWPRDGVGEPVIFTHWGGLVVSLAVLADGRLASGDAGEQIKLWPRDGVGKPVILQHGTPVLSLAVLADGRLASGGGVDGQIKLWPRDGVDEPVILQHASSVRSPVYGSSVQSLVVLADGRLASGGVDGQIKLWPPDGVGEAVILSHGSPVKSLAVLADGRLASGGVDGQIKLWPRDNVGEPAILSHGSPVRSLAVLATGRLASGGSNGQIKLWLVEEERLIVALCLRAGRNLTKDEWVRYIGSDIPWRASCRDRPSNWRTPSP